MTLAKTSHASKARLEKQLIEPLQPRKLSELRFSMFHCCTEKNWISSWNL